MSSSVRKKYAWSEKKIATIQTSIEMSNELRTVRYERLFIALTTAK